MSFVELCQAIERNMNRTGSAMLIIVRMSSTSPWDVGKATNQTSISHPSEDPRGTWFKAWSVPIACRCRSYCDTVRSMYKQHRPVWWA